MKKIAALLFALIMLFSLAACGAHTTEKDGTISTNPDENTMEQPTATQEETTETVENEIPFTEMVAIDNEECSIKFTGIEADNIWGYTVKTVLENKSSDKTYMFAIESASINGVQCDPFFATEVVAGKKSNEKISFADDSFEKSGITEVTDIEITFRVYDSEDWSADAVAEETVHIYPYGEEKAVKFVREAQPSDNVIINNDAVTVTVTGYGYDDIMGYTVHLFLENKTDKRVMFSVEAASVNGFMADPFYAYTVSSGTCAFSSISWADSTLKENDISDVETIEFNFRAYDEENWSDDDLANETITLNP